MLKPRRLALTDVSLATHYARREREKLAQAALAAMVDPERDRRCAKDAVLLSGLPACPTCFYLRAGRFVIGQAFTDYTCGICHGTFQHPNTGVPKICPGCALKNELCARCGADVHLRERRRAEVKVPRKRVT